MCFSRQSQRDSTSYRALLWSLAVMSTDHARQPRSISPASVDPLGFLVVYFSMLLSVLFVTLYVIYVLLFFILSLFVNDACF